MNSLGQALGQSGRANKASEQWNSEQAKKRREQSSVSLQPLRKFRAPFLDPLSSLSWSLEQASELTSDSSQQGHFFFLEQVWSVTRGLGTSCVSPGSYVMSSKKTRMCGEGLALGGGWSPIPALSCSWVVSNPPENGAVGLYVNRSAWYRKKKSQLASNFEMTCTLTIYGEHGIMAHIPWRLSQSKR